MAHLPSAVPTTTGVEEEPAESSRTRGLSASEISELREVRLEAEECQTNVSRRSGHDLQAASFRGDADLQSRGQRRNGEHLKKRTWFVAWRRLTCPSSGGSK